MKQHNIIFIAWALEYIPVQKRWFSAHELLGIYVTSSSGRGGSKRYIGNASSIGAALRRDSRFTSTKLQGHTVYKVKGMDL